MISTYPLKRSKSKENSLIISPTAFQQSNSTQETPLLSPKEKEIKES